MGITVSLFGLSFHTKIPLGHGIALRLQDFFWAVFMLLFWLGF